MVPQKGEYPPELLNVDGTLKRMPVGDEDEEKKTDAALGHLVMSAIRGTFKGPQGLLIALLMAWLGLSPLTAFWRAKPVEEGRVLKAVAEMQADVVEIKVTNKAILNTLPEQARKEALRSVSLQLAAIAMSRRKDAE